MFRRARLAGFKTPRRWAFVTPSRSPAQVRYGSSCCVTASSPATSAEHRRHPRTVTQPPGSRGPVLNRAAQSDK